MGTGRVDCGGGGGGETRRSYGALPTATTGVVQGSEDVRDVEAREGSTVLDGTHPGILPPDLSELVRLGP